MEKQDLSEKINLKDMIIVRTGMMALKTGINPLELDLGLKETYLVQREYSQRLPSSLPYSFEQ